MPSLYRGKSEHTSMFERLKLDAPECKGLLEDIKGFISSSVLDKMESVRGGGATDSGSTLGELRRVGWIIEWGCTHTQTHNLDIPVFFAQHCIKRGAHTQTRLFSTHNISSLLFV